MHLCKVHVHWFCEPTNLAIPRTLRLHKQEGLTYRRSSKLQTQYFCDIPWTSRLEGPPGQAVPASPGLQGQLD